MIYQNYLTEIKAKLITIPIVDNMNIVKEKGLSYQGYFRARLTLSNGDFLEVVEFFKVKGEQLLQKIIVING
jgi:hypothetical protein